MKSRRGIYYNLDQSPYKACISGIFFYFSSKNHMQAFLDRYIQNRDKINLSLTNRFNMFVKVDLLADVVLYNKIETRGFLIKTMKGEKIEWLDNLLFVGDQVIIRTLKDESEILIEK